MGQSRDESLSWGETLQILEPRIKKKCNFKGFRLRLFIIKYFLIGKYKNKSDIEMKEIKVYSSDNGDDFGLAESETPEMKVEVKKVNTTFHFKKCLGSPGVTETR